jgi:Asp-tRNA(Asn)/Glu-tRNA(Gln) amidotransferase B subunit
MTQVTYTGAIQAAVVNVMAANPKNVNEIIEAKLAK